MQTFGWLIVVRCIAGAFAQAELAISVTMVTEQTPAERRGLLYSLVQGGWPVGVFLAAGVYSLTISFGWHVVFLFGVIPILAVMARRRFLHEPERFRQMKEHKTFSRFTDRPERAQCLHNRSGVPYRTRWLAIDEHTGTHLDAPSHFVPPVGSGLPAAGAAGDISLERVPVTQACGPAVVIDVSDLCGQAEPGESPRVTIGHLNAFGEEYGPVRPGDVVLLRSGWDRLYRSGREGNAYGWDVIITKSAPGWPAPDQELVCALSEKGVRCLGTDGLSVGPADDGRPVHVAGLSRSMVFVEALTNLSSLQPRGAFFLMLFLKIEEGTGGPGRAIALLPG